MGTSKTRESAQTRLHQMAEQTEKGAGRVKRLTEDEEYQDAIDLVEPWLTENRRDAKAWAGFGAAHPHFGNWTDAKPCRRCNDECERQ